jgi:Ca2+-binding RTX toxin-like protein
MATFDIDFLSGTRTFEEIVSTTQPQDFYRFRLASVSEFALGLGGLSQNADVFLYLDRNNNGLVDRNEEIVNSRNFSSQPEGISRLLGAGTYIVEVANNFNSNTEYTLTLSGTSTGIGDIAGIPPFSAFDLGLLNQPREFEDFVGFADPQDYYKFRIEQAGDFQLNLSNLGDNANAKLYRDLNLNSQIEDGELLLSSTNVGTTEESIQTALNPGQYFILIDNGSDLFSVGSDTLYTLNVSLTIPTSEIITNASLFNLFKTLTASVAVGVALRKVFDLTLGDDVIQLTPGTLATFPAGVRGFEGNDLIYGSTENDVIYGNIGLDVFFGNAGNDILLGGRDNDQLFGEVGNDILNGNKNDDIVNGGAGNDLLRGGQDNDLLLAEAGNDILIGDFGSDTLSGGVGADIFVLRVETEKGNLSATLADQIVDFGAGDRIAIAGNLTLDNLNFVGAGGNTLIQETRTNDILGVVFNTSSQTVRNATFFVAGDDAALISL